MKVLIIGGVAGGATAAARLRRLDENAEIIMIDKGAYISYANCGLPYYIGGTIAERNKLFLQTPTSFGNRYDVDVRTFSEAIAIDKENRTVTIRSLRTGKEYKESYDKLLLSMGVEPVLPPIEGNREEGVFVLRNVEHTDAIKQYVTAHAVKRAVVVGAGFVGMEMAENLYDMAADVTIADAQTHVLPPLDVSMAAMVQQHLKDKGIHLKLRTMVQAIHRHADGLEVCYNDGTAQMADIVVFSVGVTAKNELTAACGIALDSTGAVVVDEHMQTSDSNIYAVGDMIIFKHPLTGNYQPCYLAGPANKQGRIAANNIAMGNCSKYNGAIGTAILKVFDLTVAFAGLSAQTMKDAGINYKSSITHSASHATYYPGSFPVSIKLNFDARTGQLYGAQVVGGQGVDKRIDVLSSVIARKAGVEDLCEVEHAYAPPYSSAKDPVNIAGFAAENLLHGLLDNITWHEVMDNPDRYYLLDVRTREEYKLGHIAGAVNIPVDELRERLDEVVPKGKQIVAYCAIGLRAYVATRILLQNGFSVLNLSGGYRTYHAVEEGLM